MSRIDELREYKDLLDSGVITREEYDTKKQVLLTRPESVNSESNHYASQQNYIQNAISALSSTGRVGDKSKIAAGLLGILLAFVFPFGIHNFYLGKTDRAIIQIIMWVMGLILCLLLIGWFVIIGVCTWQLIEGILILTSKTGSPWHLDGYGNELQD